MEHARGCTNPFNRHCFGVDVVSPCHQICKSCRQVSDNSDDIQKCQWTCAVTGVHQAVWHQSLLCGCGDNSIRGTELPHRSCKMESPNFLNVDVCKKSSIVFPIDFLFLVVFFRRSKDMTPWKIMSRHLRKHRQARILANRLWFAKVVGTCSAKFWSLHSGPRFGPPKKAYLCVGQWTTQKKLIVHFISVHRLLLFVLNQSGFVKWQMWLSVVIVDKRFLLNRIGTKKLQYDCSLSVHVDSGSSLNVSSAAYDGAGFFRIFWLNKYMRDTAGFVFIRVHRRVQIAGETTLQKNMHLVNALDLQTLQLLHMWFWGPVYAC